MDEYIDREAALKNLCYKCNIEFSYEPCEPSDCFIIGIIRSLPAADVVPVVHAHIVLNDDGYCHCSNCGEVADPGKRFCASCGARLDKPEMREW